MGKVFEAYGICCDNKKTIVNCKNYGSFSAFNVAYGIGREDSISAGKIINCINRGSFSGSGTVIGITETTRQYPVVGNCVTDAQINTTGAIYLTVKEKTHYDNVSNCYYSNLSTAREDGVYAGIGVMFDSQTLQLDSGESVVAVLNAFVDDYNAASPAVELKHWSADELNALTPGEICSHEKIGEKCIVTPTCTEDGACISACLSCGKLFGEERIIPAPGHFEGVVQQREATCRAAGYRYVYCRICNLRYIEETTPSLPHGELVEFDTGATCTTSGRRGQKCTVCGLIVVSERYFAPHTIIEDVSERIEPTCNSDGARYGCCSVCNNIIRETIPATGNHTPGNRVTERVASCLSEGAIRTRCTVCRTILEEEILPVTDHEIDEWELYREATCRRKGLMIRKCKSCGLFLEEEELPINENNHNSGRWITETEPTCSQTGIRRRYCRDCNVLLAEESIEKTAHTLTTTIIDSTCSQTGVRRAYCTTCNTLVAEESIEKKPHTLTTTTVAATCTSEGSITTTCSVCGQVIYREVLSRKNHNETTCISMLPATCISSGHTEGTMCADCGITLKSSEPIPASGHADSNGDSVCDICGEYFGTPTEPEKQPCSCNCHKSGFAGFIWKIQRIFYKLFGKNKICSCGIAHY